MQPPPPPTDPQQPPHQQREVTYVAGDESGFSLLIAAAVFVFFGYVNPLLPAISDPWFVASHTLFLWTARIAVVVLGAAALLTFARVPFARWLNLIGSAASGAVCLAVGAYWLFSGLAATTGFILLILGAMGLYSASGAWTMIRLSWRPHP